MEEFIKYCKRSNKDKIFLILVGLIFVAAGVYTVIEVNLFGILSIVVGFLPLIYGLTVSLKEKKQVKKLEQEGLLQDISEDFSYAIPYMDDLVRFGDKYIFRRNFIIPIAYSEIKTVQYESTLENTDRSTHYVYRIVVGIGTKFGQELYRVSYPHPEQAKQLIDIIKDRNPSVEDNMIL